MTHVPSTASPSRHIIGCMTGTSLDGIDVAVVRVEGVGSAMRASFVHGVSDSLGELRMPLRALAEQQPMTAGAIARLAREFSLLHARVCERLLREVHAAMREPLAIDAVCVHGQTVFHEPPVSWQLFEAAPLAAALGVPVISNLRQADLARGGQGAPITPLADVVLFGQARAGEGAVDAIINLGGFCNVTAFEREGSTTQVLGIDVCACNHVLDAIARIALHASFDEDGAAAMRGSVHAATRDKLVHALRAQHAQRRSLGTGDELEPLLRELASSVRGDDLACSACEAIAAVVRDALPPRVNRVLVAGGGERNAGLMRALRQRFASCESTAAAGVPPAFREAACFAVLGAMHLDGVGFYGRQWPAVGGAVGGERTGEEKAKLLNH